MAGTPEKKRRKKKATKRERLSTKHHAAHAGERIKAVLHCLQASCGARKTLSARFVEGDAPVFPNTSLSVLAKALRTVKAAGKPTGHWTEATVGALLFPAGRQQESNHLLTTREEQSQHHPVLCEHAASGPLGFPKYGTSRYRGVPQAQERPPGTACPRAGD